MLCLWLWTCEDSEKEEMRKPLCVALLQILSLVIAEEFVDDDKDAYIMSAGKERCLRKINEFFSGNFQGQH